MGLQTTQSAGLSDEMKTFYDRVLLERTVPKLLFAKFAQTKKIPANSGRIVEFRKFASLAVATTPLIEGTLFTALKDPQVTAITATVAQYGDAIGFSDLVSTVAIDPILKEFAEIQGEQAGETIDELVRDVVSVGTTVQFATGKASRLFLAATDVLTPADTALISLNMELNRATKIDGFWQVITHPRVIYDLMRNVEWRDAQNYNKTGRIFDGSIGELYGCKFWSTDKAKVYADASNGAGSTGPVDVYVTLVFGRNAFGRVVLSGHNLETIFKPLGSAGAADPLNQQGTMGWKVTFGVKRLQEAFMLRYESAASTGANT